MAKTSHTQPFQHFIGGDWVDSKDGAVFDIFNPLDDSVYGQAAKGAAADMRSAVSAGKAAFPSYRATLPMERERMLLRVAEIMERRQAAAAIGATFLEAPCATAAGVHDVLISVTRCVCAGHACPHACPQLPPPHAQTGAPQASSPPSRPPQLLTVQSERQRSTAS